MHLSDLEIEIIEQFLLSYTEGELFNYPKIKQICNKIGFPFENSVKIIDIQKFFRVKFKSFENEKK
jgi:hypothetical protein